MSATPGMTREEALKEARRRWGCHGSALIEGEWLKDKRYHDDSLSTYEIHGMTEGAHVVCCGHYDYRGRDESARCDQHWGQGETWEAALADATRRESGREKGER